MRRALRVLLWLAATAAGVFLLAVAIVAVLERGTFFQDRIRQQLARYVVGQIAIGEVDVSVAGRTLRATDLALREAPGAPIVATLPELEVCLPLAVPGERLMPDWVRAVRPQVIVEELPDGRFSPLHLIKPPPPAQVVPMVRIEDGVVLLEGSGPLDRFLDGVLRPDLERRITEVMLTTWPVPATSPLLFGFSGTLQLPKVAQLEVRGSVARDSGIELSGSLARLSLAGETLHATLDADLHEAVQRHVRGGEMDLAFALRLAGVRAEEPHAEDGVSLRLGFHALQLAHPAIDGLLEVPSAEVAYDGTQVRVRDAWIIRGPDTLELEGALSPRAEVHGLADLLGDFRFDLRGRDLSFDHGAAAALAHPVLRRAIDDYAPTGTYDLAVEAWRQGGADPVVRWSLRPRQATASYEGHVRADGRPVGFPYRLRELAGEVGGEGRRIEIRSLRGRHNGDGIATIDGTVDLLHQDVALDVRVRAGSAPVDDDLLDALEHVAPGARAVFQRFGDADAPLSGIVDIDVRVWSDPGDPVTHHAGVVAVREGRCRPEWLPVSLDLAGGRVVFEDGTYHLHDVQGTRGPTRVRVDGTVDTRGLGPIQADGPHPVPGLDLRITATGVRLDDAGLREALGVVAARGANPRRGRLLERLLPGFGTLDVTVELLAEPGGEVHYRARLYPRGIDYLPRWFALPLKGVVGQVEFGDLPDGVDDTPGFHVRVDQVSARYEGAEVTCSARFAGDRLHELRVEGAALPVRPELLAAARAALDGLPEGGALAGWLESLQPCGAADVLLRLSPTPAGAPPALRLEVVLEGAALADRRVPGGVLRDLRADLALDLERRHWRIDHLAATLGAGPGRVTAERVAGALELGRQAAMSGDLSLRRFPVPDTLRALGLAVGTGADLASVDATGEFDLDLARLVLAPLDGGSLRVDAYEGRLRLHDCGLALPAVEGVDAVAHVRGVPRPDGGMVHEIRLEDGTLHLLRPARSIRGAAREALELSRVTGLVRLDPAQIEVRDAFAAVGGGSLQAEQCTFPTLAGNGAFGGGVRLRQIDLHALQRWLSDTPSRIDGRLDLDFAFAGPSLSALSGRGRAEVADGRLWELPVLAQLYRFTLGALLGRSERPVFATGVVDFELHEGRVLLNDMVLDAPVGPTPVGLKLEGRGHADFQGNLRLRIDPTLIGTEIPLVSPIIDAVKGQLISYRVTGTFTDPRVAYENPVQSLFSGLLPAERDALHRPRLPPRASRDWSQRF